MLNNGAKREKKKAGSDKDSKLSPLFIFKLLLLAISFMVGYLLGKYGGNVDNNREKLPCRTTKKSSRTLPVSSDSESDTPCYSGSSSLCPSFYSPNKSLAVLTMGGSTAPTDIFPFLHHPTSPVQWGFYLTSQPKVLDEDGNQISNEILWGAPKKNNRKKKKKKNSKEMAEPPTPAPSPRLTHYNIRS